MNLPPLVTQAPSKTFATDKLTDVATWVGRAFVALAAIATFFGVKEGVLDRILRTDAHAALWIFCLLGLGVLLSVVAPTLEPAVRIGLPYVLLMVLALGGLSVYFFPDLPRDRYGVTNWLTAALVLAALVAAVIWRRQGLPGTVALLLVGVTAVALGSFGATKVAVLSKNAPDEPRLTATLDGGSLKVTVEAGKREGRPLVVVVTSPSAKEKFLGRARLSADAVGEIAASLEFPVDVDAYPELRIGYCDKPEVCDAATDAINERVRLVSPRPPPARAGALLAQSAQGVVATLSATQVAPQATVRFTLSRTRQGATGVVSTVVLVPDSTGAVTATAAAVPAVAGDQVTVRYAICSGECTDDKDVASLTVDGSQPPPPG